MNVLLGCEFSGVVREAMRAKGHNAVSCDLLPAADNSPHHIQDDILNHLDDGWDLAIFFPPCTHLAVSGAHRFKYKQKEQAEALRFVSQLLEAKIPKIALENPVGIISSRIRKPDQIIQPYQFGHDASKKTCLWLKGLPLLTTTKLVTGRYVCPNRHIWGGPEAYRNNEWVGLTCPQCKQMFKRRIWGNQTPSGQNKLGPSADRWKLRSWTYKGIAEAMAEQWGKP